MEPSPSSEQSPGPGASNSPAERETESRQDALRRSPAERETESRQDALRRSPAERETESRQDALRRGPAGSETESRQDALRRGPAGSETESSLDEERGAASQRRSGICIPLLSLWSEESLGCGELLDLLPLFPWMKAAGCSVLQLLPLNDSGWDPSPYALCSGHALHPIYLRLAALPFLDRLPQQRDALAALHKPPTLWVEYTQVLQEKLLWFKRYYEQTCTWWAHHPGFQQFCTLHHNWLIPYVRYKALQEHFQWIPSTLWPAPLPNLEEMERPWALLQYLLSEQLSQVHTAAQEHGVQIFGDLPILVSRESADIWAHPELFNPAFDAGAPPDAYSKAGQNWGFPIYAWNAHVASNFSWWKERLSVASLYYDLYRLDHVLGFFRIWAIPHGFPATQGAYLPEEEEAWLPQGRAILRLLQLSSSMLPMAEDLGTVPPGVRQTLQALGIPGMTVIRWEQHKGVFTPLESYPPLSVCCYSTHDSSLIGEWWTTHPIEAKSFCRSRGHSFSPQLSIQERRWLLQESCSAGSRWVIHLLQECLAAVPALMPEAIADRRINLPGTTSPTNWTQRLPCSVEAILQSQELKNLLQSVSCEGQFNEASPRSLQSPQIED